MRVKRKTKIKMREIKANQIKDKIKELFLKANSSCSGGNRKRSGEDLTLK